MTLKEFIKWRTVYMGTITHKTNEQCRFYRRKFGKHYPNLNLSYFLQVMQNSESMYNEWIQKIAVE